MRGFVKFVVLFVLVVLSAACATTSGPTDDELRQATVKVQGYWGPPPAPEAKRAPEPECSGCYCNEYGQWVGKDGQPAEINGQPIHCKPNTKALQQDDIFYLPGFGRFLFHRGLIGDTDAGHGFQKEDGSHIFCPFKPGCFVSGGEWKHSSQQDEFCLDASLCYEVEEEYSIP